MLKKLGKLGYLLTILTGILLIIDSVVAFNADSNQSLGISFLAKIIISILYLLAVLSHQPTFRLSGFNLPNAFPDYILIIILILFGLFTIYSGFQALKGKILGNVLSYICIFLVILGAILSKSYIIAILLSIPAILIFMDRKDLKKLFEN